MSFKFNPFTGNFDLVGHGGGGTSPDNFSYLLVDSGQEVVIPLGQQMLFKGDIRVLGDLIVRGELTELIDINQHQVSRVRLGDVHLVPIDCVMFFRQLKVEGDLRVQGDLVEI